MRVHVGIACNRCERVYFVGRSTYQIELYDARGGVYRLVCPAPCNAVRSFQKGDMRPYLVSLHSYYQGLANRDDSEQLNYSDSRPDSHSPLAWGVPKETTNPVKKDLVRCPYCVEVGHLLHHDGDWRASAGIHSVRTPPARFALPHSAIKIK
jgi:hypothetical protein